MELGVRSRLLIVSVVLVLVASVSSAVFLELRLRPLLEKRVETELLRHARAVREAVLDLPPGASMQMLDAMADRLGQAVSARVTLIRADGEVLGDSDLDTARVATIVVTTRSPGQAAYSL